MPVDEKIEDDFILSDHYITSVFQKILKTNEQVSTVHRTIYRVHQRVVTKMTHGRVLLAGDSAHLNNPLGGFGMNGGLHDAWNLAEKLKEILNASAKVDLLDLYDRQRRTIMNDFIQAQTIRNKRMIEESGEEHQQSEWERMRKIHGDDEERKKYMLSQSMEQSLIKEQSIK